MTDTGEETMRVGWWWLTPLIPAFGRQSQTDLCEFEASLVFRVSSRTTRATRRNLVSKNKKTKQINKTNQPNKQKETTRASFLHSQIPSIALDQTKTDIYILNV